MRGLALLLLLLAQAPSRASGADDVWKPRVKRHPKLINTTHTTMSKGTLLTIDNATRCMDNTPAYYYFAGATENAMITTWFIYLPGKAWCYSAASCFLLSFWDNGAAGSKKVAPSLSLDGIFSPDATKNPAQATPFWAPSTTPPWAGTTSRAAASCAPSSPTW
jgi:Pectinacetylesterase